MRVERDLVRDSDGDKLAIRALFEAYDSECGQTVNRVQLGCGFQGLIGVNVLWLRIKVWD